MKLQLKRRFKGKDYTIGDLFIDGKKFCETLEDTDRKLQSNMTLDEIKKIKIAGETAIPTGTYKVVTNVVSPKYSTRDAYKFCEGKVPRLENVPGYQGILIHIGNYNRDTSGCILVGFNKLKGQLINSTDTFKKLYEIISKEKDIMIEIV
jgi:hypothetical protein